MTLRIRNIVAVIAMLCIGTSSVGCSPESESARKSHGDLSAGLHQDRSVSEPAANKPDRANESPQVQHSNSDATSETEVANPESEKKEPVKRTESKPAGKDTARKTDVATADRNPATDSKQKDEPAREPEANPKPPAAPDEPAPLKIHVVKSESAGDLDIYVVNETDETITNCTMLLFNEFEMDVSPSMKPGQVGICALGGEIPDKIVFRSDQFKSFEFVIPEKPLDELDVSKFDWAETPETDPGDDG